MKNVNPKSQNPKNQMNINKTQIQKSDLQEPPLAARMLIVGPLPLCSDPFFILFFLLSPFEISSFFLWVLGRMGWNKFFFGVTAASEGRACPGHRPTTLLRAGGSATGAKAGEPPGPSPVR